MLTVVAIHATFSPFALLEVTTALVVHVDIVIVPVLAIIIPFSKVIVLTIAVTVASADVFAALAIIRHVAVGFLAIFVMNLSHDRSQKRFSVPRLFLLVELDFLARVCLTLLGDSARHTTTFAVSTFVKPAVNAKRRVHIVLIVLSVFTISMNFHVLAVFALVATIWVEPFLLAVLGLYYHAERYK